jgi:hypothetical protein
MVKYRGSGNNTNLGMFNSSLKGLSHEIFGPVFWAVWMYLGLNVNRLWFLNFNSCYFDFR